MHDDPTAPSTPPAPRAVNRTAVLLVATAIALAIGSLTPWLTVLGFGISGVSIHYGIVSLVTAGLLGLLAYFATRDTSIRAWRATAAAAGLGGLLCVASALYVGWAIRSSYADEGTDTSELAQSFADAFRPGLGIGLWLVLLAGAATVLLTLPTVLQRPLWSRGVVVPLVALTLLATAGGVAADQKAQSDHRKDVAAAQAKAKQEAEDAARAEAEAEAAEAAAEQAAEAAAEADRQRFTVKLAQCRSDEYGGATITGTLVNEGNEPHTYEITVAMLDKAGAQVDTATDYVNDLPAGSTASWEALGFGEFAECAAPVVEVSEY